MNPEVLRYAIQRRAMLKEAGLLSGAWNLGKRIGGAALKPLALAAGLPFRAAGAVAGAGSRMVGKAGSSMLGKGFDMFSTAMQKAPLEMGLGAAFAPMAVADAVGGIRSARQQTAQMTGNMAAFNNPGGMVRYANDRSGIFSQSLPEAEQIYKSMKKTAGKGSGGKFLSDLLRAEEEISVLRRALKKAQQSGADPKVIHQIEKKIMEMTHAYKSRSHAFDPVKYLGYGALLSAGGAAVGAIGQAGAHVLGKATEKAREKSRGYRYQAMLKADPTLRQEPLAPQLFAVLDRASPYIAGEPYVAAATVQAMVNTPAIQQGGVPAITPKMMQDILSAEKQRQETRFPFLQTKAPKGPDRHALALGEVD